MNFDKREENHGARIFGSSGGNGFQGDNRGGRDQGPREQGGRELNVVVDMDY